MMNYRLTSSQKNIWNLQKFYEDTTVSSICGAMFLEEKMGEKILQKALNVFLKEQEGFRLQFQMVNGEVVQSVCEYEEELFPQLQFDTMEEFHTFVEEEKKIPFAESGEKMYRLFICNIGKKVAILAILSHLISDAWTLSLLGSRVFSVSKALLAGEEPSMQNQSYIQHIENEEKYFASARFQSDREFWENQYEKKPDLAYIKPERQGGLSIQADRYTALLDKEFSKKLRNFCDENKVTPAVLFEAAIYGYLGKINSELDTLTIGTPVLNRVGKSEKQMAGMFISTVPLTINKNQEQTVRDLLNNTTASHRSCFRHQRYPYGEIQEYLREKHGLSGKLYDVMVSYQNAKITGDTNFYTEWYSNGYSEVALQVHIDDRDSMETFRINLDYQMDVFKGEKEVVLLYRRILFILQQMIENVDIQIGQIDIIPEGEKQILLQEFNQKRCTSKIKGANFLSVDKIFAHSNSIAIIDNDRKITYSELDKLSNIVSNYLTRIKSEIDQFVIICMPKCSELIVSILATFKSGLAYIPIDPDVPRERLEFIVSDSRSKIILNMDFYQKAISEKNASSTKKRTSSDICYAIYTSGSTGKPKMVGISYDNLNNYILNLQYLYGEKKINMPFFTNQGVDLTITSIFLPLTTGGCIYVYEDDIYTVLNEISKNENLNIIKMTPTHMQIFNNYIEARTMKNIRYVILGGENLLAADAHDFLCKFGKHIEIHNEYGPTETTVGCADYIYDEKINNEKVVPIGRAFQGINLYILDNYNRLLPIGCVGELCIAGRSVGLGYINREDLTIQKFIMNPFGEGRLYKTGDLAYYKENGDIVCIGRKDFQVKINGRRIELEEIEVVMGHMDGISQVIVDVKEIDSIKCICAYYVAKKEKSKNEFNNFLKTKLPHYMVPKIYIKIDEIPMARSGKVDKNMLPVPRMSMESYVNPITKVQCKLCEIIKDILKIKKYGIRQNFFDFGGDSLSAIELVVRAEKIGIKIKTQAIFDYPTVEQLAEVIEHGEAWEDDYKPERFEKYQDFFKENYVRNSYDVQDMPIKTVLLSGITGFLGSHILDELLSAEDCKVYCLVRSVSTDDRRGRFPQMLEYYFGNKYHGEIGKRIIPIVGDITDENLSNDLPEKVDLVIHSAATVKHYGFYDYFYKVNTLGTKHMARYALKVGAKFVYISTVSVSGNSFADPFEMEHAKEERFFDETTLYQGQSMENVYVRSKFEAECAVLDCVLEGLQANIIRVGNLTNRSTDFKFQPNYEENAFLSRIKAVLEFGCLPDYLLPLYCEFSPINDVANAVVKIATHFNTKYTVFHVNSNKVLCFDRMVELLHEMNIPMKIVDAEEFISRLKEMIGSKQSYIYEAFVNDLDEDGKLAYDSNTRIHNDFTYDYLKKLGFDWTDIDYQYLKGYVEYFRKLGYLKV